MMIRSVIMGVAFLGGPLVGFVVGLLTRRPGRSAVNIGALTAVILWLVLGVVGAVVSGDLRQWIGFAIGFASVSALLSVATFLLGRGIQVAKRRRTRSPPTH